jgi:tRNA G18 (ribose-2'-O)-methylase SpoU
VSVDEIAQQMRNENYKIVGTAASEEAISYVCLEWNEGVAIVLGQEGAGMSVAWKNSVDRWIKIPMQPPVESLNVGAAAAVLLFESARQPKSR